MNTLAIPDDVAMDRLARLANLLHSSGMFPDCKTTQQAGVKVLAGMALGFDAFTSMQCIDIIQGKASLSGLGWATKIRQSPRYDYRIIESSDTRCAIEFLGDGKPLGPEVVFTIDDARKAGLAGKSTWKQYPRAMLRNRAMTEGARMYCPDVGCGSIYTKEELSDGDWVSEADIEVAEADLNSLPESPSTASGDDGAVTEDDAAPDAAPSPEELLVDDDTFRQTVEGLVRSVSLPAGYMNSLLARAGVSRLMELSTAQRVALVYALKEMK